MVFCSPSHAARLQQSGPQGHHSFMATSTPQSPLVTTAHPTLASSPPATPPPPQVRHNKFSDFGKTPQKCKP